jgi:alpha-mannosidase
MKETMDAKEISRRKFLVSGAAAIGALAGPEILGRSVDGQNIQASVPASRKVLHVIGYSHVDAAWLWPWRDSSNLVLTTARSALDRMNETPGFRYCHSSSMHYRWIQKADPAMFEEILRRIREGRWEVVGGWPVEPDCNIPATESFARHGLYGKAYCKQALGVDVKIGFNPDSFGHAAGLPTILKQSGYDYYVFMRPQDQEQEPGKKLPLLFWWEGPDGSRVLTLRILGSYDSAAARIPIVAKDSFAPGFSDGALFLGVGDHGGAVTKAQIQQVLEMRKDSTLPELRWSTTSEFFASVKASPAMANLPVISGDLQHHSRGCYSACGEEKYQNRRAERAMVQVESLSWLTCATLGRKYPGTEFADAWWNILFNQFHDLLAGTALYSDYQDARDGLGTACQTATATKIEALESIARRVNTEQAEGGLVFAFNCLPWARKTYLQYIPGRREAPITCLKAQDGSKVPVQERPSESMTTFYPRLAAWVDLPAFGYRVFSESFDAAPPPSAYGTAITVSDNAFGISSLKTSTGTELLASRLGLVVIADSSDTWSHGVDQFRQEIGRPEFVSSKVVEDGPVLRITRQRLRWQDSDIAVDISTFPQSDIVQFHFVINWQQHEQILKLEIPTALTGAKVFAAVPGAVTEKATNGNEEPYQDWVAVQGKSNDEDYTVALLNHQTYSYDCLDGLLRTILIRSAPYARHNPGRVQPESLDAWQDQGRQERTFWLVGRPGPYTGLHLDRLANELQMPAEYVMDSRHSGSESWDKSFLELAPETVSILAIKQAENSGGTIVRIQERSGKPTVAHLSSSLLQLDHDVHLTPWELKTLRIDAPRHGKVTIREVSILES